jgi:hypothetical protein
MGADVRGGSAIADDFDVLGHGVRLRKAPGRKGVEDRLGFSTEARKVLPQRLVGSDYP